MRNLSKLSTCRCGCNFYRDNLFTTSGRDYGSQLSKKPPSSAAQLGSAQKATVVKKAMPCSDHGGGSIHNSIQSEVTTAELDMGPVGLVADTGTAILPSPPSEADLLTPWQRRTRYALGWIFWDPFLFFYGVALIAESWISFKFELAQHQPESFYHLVMALIGGVLVVKPALAFVQTLIDVANGGLKKVRAWVDKVFPKTDL
jgi:hypothetical protein